MVMKAAAEGRLRSDPMPTDLKSPEGVRWLRRQMIANERGKKAPKPSNSAPAIPRGIYVGQRPLGNIIGE